VSRAAGPAAATWENTTACEFMTAVDPPMITISLLFAFGQRARNEALNLSELDCKTQPGRILTGSSMLASQLPGSDSWMFVPLFLIFLVCMWLFVGFAISRGGWNSFAIRYPASTRPTGKTYVSSNTRFSNYVARYNNVVRVTFTDAGVYFHVLFLFRAFHPPFLVPWDKVKRIEKRKVLFWTRYQMDIDDVPGQIHVILPPSIEHDLPKYANSTFPTPG
jgi:hypothetical protein